MNELKKLLLEGYAQSVVLSQPVRSTRVKRERAIDIVFDWVVCGNTLAVVGTKYGISGTRVRQIASKMERLVLQHVKKGDNVL